MATSPDDILTLLSEYTAIDLFGAFVRPEALRLLKGHTRFARQNGIHASPTVMVDGLVDDHIASRDEIGDWVEKLGLVADA